MQPIHTMHGFEWKDQRGIEGVGFVRALRTLLTSHLPAVLPQLDAAIANELDVQLRRNKAGKGKQDPRTVLKRTVQPDIC